MENKEPTIEEKLKDKVYVNYNILKSLDEIKNILLQILEVDKILPRKLIDEEKEDRDGVFKNAQ